MSSASRPDGPDDGHYLFGPQTALLLPEQDGTVRYRPGHERDWRLAGASDWEGAVFALRPERVIVCPLWRSRLGTTLRILDRFSGCRRQIAPADAAGRVLNAEAVAGGPIDVSIRVRTCLESAWSVERGAYDFPMTHPLYPAFDADLFGDPSRAMAALLWVIDPRLFVSPAAPQHGWRGRLHKAMGVGMSFRKARHCLMRRPSPRLVALHKAWAVNDIAELPLRSQPAAPSTFLWKYYMATRARVVDRPGDHRFLNAWAAVLTARHLLNFLGNAWLHCAYGGRYQILDVGHYVPDPAHRLRFEEAITRYWARIRR